MKAQEKAPPSVGLVVSPYSQQHIIRLSLICVLYLLVNKFHKSLSLLQLNLIVSLVHFGDPETFIIK
jgi:hypothetical protein